MEVDSSLMVFFSQGKSFLYLEQWVDWNICKCSYNYSFLQPSFCQEPVQKKTRYSKLDNPCCWFIADLYSLTLNSGLGWDKKNNQLQEILVGVQGTWVSLKKFKTPIYLRKVEGRKLHLSCRICAGWTCPFSSPWVRGTILPAVHPSFLALSNDVSMALQCSFCPHCLKKVFDPDKHN